jgi:hypothetical protein
VLGQELVETGAVVIGTNVGTDVLPLDLLRPLLGLRRLLSLLRSSSDSGRAAERDGCAP